jgi:hypothetical protein
MQYYMMKGGQRKGPFDLGQLVAEGLERDTLVWFAGQKDWTRADQVPALGELMLTIPPPVPRVAEPLVLPPLDEATLAAAWVRYKPATFRTLYSWYVLLLCMHIALAVAATVCIVVAANTRTYRNVPMDQFGFRENRFVHDAAAAHRRDVLTVVGTILFVVAGLALVGNAVLFFVQLYKAWHQIQDGHAQTSAGKAVGFLFIPFFNLFWVFVAVYGLAWDLHRYVMRHRLFGRHDLSPFPVSPGLALACCILTVCTVVPFLNFATVLPLLIVQVILLYSIKNASMGIAAERLQQPPWTPEAVRVPAPEPVEMPPEPMAGSEHVRRHRTE